ncbi:S8 family peptidase [Sphingomonas sp. HMP6]|uniref:S8 family peptidase n=1 Tax=Sphingomonas sp. HMP6 TaxID=1517551 RepID=UPI00159651F9|nr:S8 family peptidase [Sphingomonas sp. HMP6]BCA58131.1 hypothetical protein HMP06_0900 [Sphingomonas sp. HMP6]
MADKNQILPLTRTPDDGLARINGRQDKRRRYTVAPETQAARLSRIDRDFANILDRDDIQVLDNPSSLAPERALVIEIIGSPKRFVNAARKIGLEWLAEEVAILRGVRSYFDPGLGLPDEDGEENDTDQLDEDDFDFLLDDRDGGEDDLAIANEESGGALYLGMPTRETFRSLRNLWDLFKANKSPPDGHGDWWGLFGLLHDIRPWGPEDRIGEAARQRLKLEQSRHAGDDLRVEVDLWYRGDALTRARAVGELRDTVERLGGAILDELRIDEILYHSALVHLPGAAVDAIVERSGPLALDDDIMSIRPQSGFRFSLEDLVTDEDLDDGKGPEDPVRASIGALIDGWPVSNHVKLRNRLDVIELDVADTLAPLSKRVHGTAMSSLILRGDLHHDDGPLDRRLKVVPVLLPDGGFEAPPRDKLALGIIHRAVIELKEGTGGQPASGPDVVIINHSICDEAFGFAGTVSPWARLLDHLAWKYKVLFVVSAGNIRDTFEVPGYPTGADMRLATPEHRRGEILRAIDAAKAQRTLFSPAESVNGLTVAAAHSDGSPHRLTGNATDPFVDFKAPNLASGLGHGFNRSVKPDVMLPGGRQVAHPTEGQILRVHGREHPARFGQSVATPDPNHGDLTMTRLSAGTSNAAALATRTGLLIGDVLDDSPINAGGPWYTRPTAASVLKALIGHGASWGELGRDMASIHSSAGSLPRRKEAVSRAIGYGPIDESRISLGGPHRVTLLGEDSIGIKGRHEWRVPLPDEFFASTEFRKVVVTLAWLTPVTPNSSQYRTIGLNMIDDSGKTQLWQGMKRVGFQPAVGFARRGTLIHAVYEGNRKAVPMDERGDFVINVQANCNMPGMTKLMVPYALAVTIEVADTIRGDIRDTIRDRLRSRSRTRT